MHPEMARVLAAQRRAELLAQAAAHSRARQSRKRRHMPNRGETLPKWRLVLRSVYARH
jgi:hypothetical protein